MPKSLIVRLPNWVGDTIMAIPTLQAMHNNGITLNLLGKPWAHDLLAGMDMPTYSLQTHFLKSVKKLRAIQSDSMVLLTNSFSSALMARCAGKKVIGYAGDRRHFFLQKAIVRPTDIHEVNYFWEIANAASHYFFSDLPQMQSVSEKIYLPLSPFARTQARLKLKSANIQNPYWVFCPFAHGVGKHGMSKIWPHWAALSSHFQDQNIVVCPGKNEETLCSELVPYAKVLPGLNLGEYAAVLSQAEKVIANDSGPMHIAAAVGADTIGIFGTSNPKRTHPWGANYIGELGQWPSLLDLINILT